MQNIQIFKTSWVCENGHTTNPSVSMLEINIEKETYSWIGNSAWDMCDNCGDCPDDEQMRNNAETILHVKLYGITGPKWQQNFRRKQMLHANKNY